MPSHALAVITGHITTPETRYTPTGLAVASFSVPVNEREKKGDEWVDAPTTWWRCTAFGKLAERAITLEKGTLVTVIGRAKLRPWIGEGGSERTSLEVVASEIQFLARPRQSDDLVTETRRAATVAADDTPDELPF